MGTFIIVAIIVVLFWAMVYSMSQKNKAEKFSRTAAQQSQTASNKIKQLETTIEQMEATAVLKSDESKSLNEQKRLLSEELSEAKQEIKSLTLLIDAEQNKKHKLYLRLTNKSADNAENIFSVENTAADYLMYNCVSNISAFPFMAKLMSDYATVDLKIMANSLNWGSSQERAKKVASIREIRKETKELLEQYKIYEYQLHYLYELFPALKDIVDTEYNELPPALNLNAIEHDQTRDYLSKEEWENLSECEKNQLALDRYKESHNKSKWQIGRDYELYVGYMFESVGYDVEYFGANMGLEDLGRDIIAKKDGITYIIQCKYWSQVKTIHEKHIAQLYGTTISYCIENDITPGKNVIGMFVTNIEFSDMAKKFADMLKIKLLGSHSAGDYPMIKCNIGTDEYGKQIKIYHLPFDQQYDSVKIDKTKGERVVTTVAEAESLGFRRAYKWHGESA